MNRRVPAIGSLAGLMAVISFSLARANPILLTFLNEFSTDPEHQWVEISARPSAIPDTWLTGWRIRTSCSECTLDCLLPQGGAIVVDSQALANHEVGSGTFRLNPDSDTIVLYTPDWSDYVAYPVLPTDLGCAPGPPSHSSASFWNYDAAMDQCFNWYIDSTPTPGTGNDDYSTISGSVLVDSLPEYAELYVWASGPYGDYCFGHNYHGTSYSISGLGAGAYHLAAVMYTSHGTWQGERQDSIHVGYSQDLTGVTIDLRTVGVADRNQSRAGKAVIPSIVRGVLRLAPAPSLMPYASSWLLDAAGRKVLDLQPGPNEVSRLGPGVYYVTAGLRSPGSRSVVRKVIITK